MKKTVVVISLVILILAAIAGSCTSGEKQPLLPSVSGRPGDLAVVVDKADWDSEIGDEFRKIFEEPYQVLPQYEPIFNMIQIPHSAFSNVMKAQRNIIIVNVSPEYNESKIIVRKDVWAKPQLILDMFAKNDSAFVKLLRDNQKKIINLLEDIERTRLMDTYKKNLDGKIVNEIKQKYHVSLLIPKGFKVYVDSSDFAWINEDVSTSILGIFIYEYNYTDTNTFTKDYLINKRNQFLKKYVPGEVEGSYMTTEREFGPFFSQYLLRGKRYIAELRGLWKMKNGISMGGPFVSITTLDQKRNKIVTIEGFVFAAGQNKRNYLRQVEAIVLSMEITE